jgi:adenine deaminase
VEIKMIHSIDQISGNIVDVIEKKVFPGTIKITGGRITQIIEEHTNDSTYIIPGFVDSHIHIESSMITPAEFARVAVIHGTVGTVSDPHEIANVMGVDGVRYMMTDADYVPFKFYWGAPSCVPATAFETAGARIGAAEVQELLQNDKVKCLSEMMNYPGVLDNALDIMEKINLAKRYEKVIDGHAPGLGGEALKQYISSGISTDHECISLSEAREKIRLGMKIQIREGSAAKNFNELIPITKEYPDYCMFCSDDKHPDDLMIGHINHLVKRATDYGVGTMNVLRIASLNPTRHYGLDVGLLQVGDAADFLIIDSLKDFTILKTIINGMLVAENGKSLIEESSKKIINNFNTKEKQVHDFAVTDRSGKIRIMEALDGELLTHQMVDEKKVVDGFIVSDTTRDILKIVVVNRYRDSVPAIGFVKNFGLRKGAIGSSISHDSHNIISVGVDDNDICRAVNMIIENRGGLCAVCGDTEKLLPLPIAGIMSNLNYREVSEKYRQLDRFAKELGSLLGAPFMTLSFMGLLVIPEIKLSDKGLFDVSTFNFVDLFVSH